MDRNRGECGLFGFCAMFGFVCSGFGACGDESWCSVCSVDFVEKMWRNLWGNRWENCGICCGINERVTQMVGKSGKNKFYTYVVEKFCGWIYTWFGLCKNGGFAQFPQSLLLRLLNI